MNHIAQKGASLTIVLVMLTVLLLGALSMYKFNEANTLIAGNVAFKDAAQQASEVGISEAFEALTTIADEEQSQGNWYYATIQGDDKAGFSSRRDAAIAVAQIEVEKVQVITGGCQNIIFGGRGHVGS
jgi:Tfp pilus assembly protein PilX